MGRADGSFSPGSSLGAPERTGFVLVPAAALAAVLWAIAALEWPLAWRAPWVPALGIDLAFRADGLSALMLLMITGVGTAVFVYAGGYLAGHPRQRRAYVLLTVFMAAMIGCVTADDVFVLFLFWEATSVVSFLLVGFDHERPESRRSAQQALLVTGSGGMALLAGLIVLAKELGTPSISEVVVRLQSAAPTPRLTAALLLILVGAFTKSAQFPFHFWLPNAMAAPTPVSAYLHSATMVKLGVYLLARLDPGFGEWPLWEAALKAVGSLTAAWGMVLALRERDLKRILAWSTVATLGTLVTLVGMRGDGAAVAAGALLLAHALYKAPLFFVAGNIDHGAGTRVIDRLGNLRHAMPLTAAAALLAGASMAGMPLSFGYLVKDAVLAAKSAAGVFPFAKVANTVFGAIAVAVAGVAAVRVFWRHPGGNETPEAHEGGAALVAPPLALAAAGIALGLFPFVARDLVAAASTAMTPGGAPIAVPFAPEPGTVLGSLLLTLAIGATVFVFWDALHRALEAAARRIGRIGMASQYERLLAWLPRTAAASTRALQSGRLPVYAGLAAAAGAAAIGAALHAGRGGLALPPAAAPSLGAAGACALICVGAAAAALLRDRLALLLASGLVGYGSALLFVFAGAPDVAFTQLVVETVFVIVVAAVLLDLATRGRAAAVAEPRVRPFALLIAAALATAVTLLLLVAAAGPLDPGLASFFAERSVPQAHGRNVVNVILVDFRALDTLGEISVVMLSLLAALPLLRALAPVRREGVVAPPRTVILEAVAGPLYAVILAASLWVLLRGHNEPGGGFIGGLVAVAATVLWAVARGGDAAARRLPLRSPVRLAAAGVAVAALAGLPALVAGSPFLTGIWFTVPIGFGEVKASTVMLFDLGVYLCVWGAVAGYALALLAVDDPAEAGR
jgi:multicomponent Na+:H+ antiporter subunit A